MGYRGSLCARFQMVHFFQTFFITNFKHFRPIHAFQQVILVVNHLGFQFYQISQFIIPRPMNPNSKLPIRPINLSYSVLSNYTLTYHHSKGVLAYNFTYYRKINNPRSSSLLWFQMETMNNFKVREKSTYLTSIQQWWVCDFNKLLDPTPNPDCGIIGGREMRDLERRKMIWKFGKWMGTWYVG